MTRDINALLARLRVALEDLPCTHQGVVDALLLLEAVEGRAAELVAAGEALVSAWDGGETSGSATPVWRTPAGSWARGRNSCAAPAPDSRHHASPGQAGHGEDPMKPTDDTARERRTTLAELVEEADGAALLHLEQQLGVTLIALPQGDARWTAPVVGQHGPISACTWAWAPRGRGRPSKGRQRTLVALDPEVLAAAKVAAAAAGESLADLVEGAVVAELDRRRQ